MSTPRDHGHEKWEELAAGHALHALEPDEELTFTAHLSTCAHCRGVVDEHALVAAQLGALADDADVEAPSWSRIRDRIVTSPAGPTQQPAPPVPVSLDERRARRRAPRILSAAAGVIVLAGVATAAWQLSDDGTHSATTAAIAACHQAPDCQVVGLEGKAVVLADAGQARVIARTLPAPSSGHVYALWQMPHGGGAPLLVGVLGSLSTSRPSAAAPLRLPYADTTAFAISVEPVGVTPTRPTQVLATGRATV